MARAPACSVVIAAYNAEATIAQALNSVLTQTRQDFEVVVVDYGSSDGTAARVEPYLADRRVRLHQQQNAGPAAARNAGISLTGGRYVAMLDSDELWLPDYLGRMTGALLSAQRAAFVFTRAWVLERATDTFLKQPWPPSAPFQDDPDAFLRNLIERDFVINSVTVRRRVLDHVGAFDPSIAAGEKYELLLRIAAHGYRATYVPGPLCVCSDLPGSLSHNEPVMLGGLRHTYTKTLASGLLPPSAVPVASARRQAVERRLAQLDRPRRSPAEAAREAVARVTGGWRQRRARLDRPPPQVAAAFPKLGRGLPQAGGLARRVVRGAGIAGAGYVATRMISLVTYLALARLLGPHEFGVFAAATVLITVGLMVGESGLLAALVQRREGLEEAFNSAFAASVAGGLVLTATAAAAAPLIGLFFDSYQIGLVAAAMSASILFKLLLIVPSARLQRNFSFVRRCVLDPVGSLAFAAGAVAGSAAGLGVWALVIGTYAQLVLDVTAAWTLVHWRPRLRLASMATWRDLARFGRPVFTANLISHASQQVPVVAVGRVLGAGALGQLSYAVRVAEQPIGAIVNVGAYVLFPAFARISPDSMRFERGLLRALRWICRIAFPLSLLLVPLGTPAVVLVFGARWQPAGHAVMALGFFCAALALDSVASEAWKAAGKPKLLPRMQGIALVTTTVCVAALVPFGLVPAAIGMTLGELAAAGYAVRGISRVTGIGMRHLLQEIWPPAVAAAVMAAALLVTEHGLVHSDRHSVALGIILLVAQVLLGLALYGFALVVLGAGSRLRQSREALMRRMPDVIFSRNRQSVSIR